MIKDKIRNLGIVIIRKGNYVLACPGKDSVKNETFYRLLGGGIDFGEHSLVALKREIKEELDVELVDYRLVFVLENIFEYNGDNGHEVDFVYEAKFKDESNYEREKFLILDKDDEGYAVWVELTEENIKKIYPSGLGNCLKSKHG